MLLWMLAITVSYFLGAIPFGYLAVRILKGVDITRYGSGATGATNVSRLLGTGPALGVGVLDVLKGVLSVTAGRAVPGSAGSLIPVLCGLSAMAGHNYSPYLRGKGGKGVATGAGVMFALMPEVLFVAVAVFALVVLATRYVSLGSIIGSAVAVAATFWTKQPLPNQLFTAVGASFIIFRHRANIERLLQGKESRLGERVKIK